MSNLKYDSSTCSSIISKLETAESKLESAKTELQEYYRSLPTADEVRARAKKLATETDDYGEEIESLTNDNYEYYMNNYGNTLINARTNLVRMGAATDVVRSNVVSVDTKVKNIETAVLDYESEIELPDETSTDGIYFAPEVPVDGSGGGSGLGFGDISGVDVTDPTLDWDDGTADDTEDTTPTTTPGINIDTDGDGKPDLNIDVDGDGVPDINIDTDGDGKPDLNIDKNGDGVPDVNIDTDGDGKPDLNIDKNGDGVPDVNIDTDGDGKPDVNIDKNGDGVPDVNVDTDGNGYPDTNIDINGDGIPDINVDTDGDGIPDKNVIPGYEHGSGDDGDGSFLSDLLKRMKLMVDDDGNVMYYDENGNIVYPFLGEGMFADPSNAQKFKMAENAFLEMLDGPEQGEAVESLDLDLEKNVPSASFAIGGMAAVGAAAANAAATMKRTKDEIDEGVRTYDYEYDDDAKLTPEQYKKRKIGTIVSVVLLTILVLANAIALIINGTSDVTIVLLGLAIAITGIITSMGIKQGKFYTIGAVLVNLLIVYILTCLGFTTSLGYVIAFAVLVIVLLYYYFTKLFERILPMFNYVPAVVGIVGIGFVGLLSVFEITHWIINLILVILIIVGYFAYNYYGIAQLEEQMEQEKQKGLSIYDYFNLKTNRKQWKYKGNIEETQIIPQTKKTSNNIELPKVNNSNKKYGKHGDNKFLEYMDNSNNKGSNQNNNNNNNNNNSKFFN